MTEPEAALFTAAAEQLRQAGLLALWTAAERYASAPPALQLELLVSFAVELSSWHDSALAAIAFLIQTPNGATIH